MQWWFSGKGGDSLIYWRINKYCQLLEGEAPQMVQLQIQMEDLVEVVKTLLLEEMEIHPLQILIDLMVVLDLAVVAEELAALDQMVETILGGDGIVNDIHWNCISMAGGGGGGSDQSFSKSQRLQVVLI